MDGTIEYRSYASLKSRCYNKNNKDYKYYGGRGITVCDRWCDSFLAFFADMGLKPFPKAQIDRINNDGDYTPENCRWTTATENNRNKSCTKLTTLKVKNIRKKYKLSSISQRKLGLIYGIGQDHISRIINNKSWIEGGSSGLSNV